jgi:hypothetical protein
LQLLDELLAVRLTIMDEPELYQPVQVIQRWWSPLPFPPQVRTALVPIIDKLTAGIVFRARGEQRSEALLQRLKEAVNDRSRFEQTTRNIVEGEPGLTGDLQDWLRGIERVPTAARSSLTLAAVGQEGFVHQLAELFRASFDASGEPNGTTNLVEMVRSLAAQYGLSRIGVEHDSVEFLPAIFDTASGVLPSERTVKVIRPAIVRRRRDGGIDVLLKGLVVDT